MRPPGLYRTLGPSFAANSKGLQQATLRRAAQRRSCKVARFGGGYLAKVSYMAGKIVSIDLIIPLKMVRPANSKVQCPVFRTIGTNPSLNGPKNKRRW